MKYTLVCLVLLGGAGMACGGSTGTTLVGAGDDAGSDATSEGGSTDPNDPLNSPAKCTSGRTWTQGNRGSALMQPGQPCITCHKTEPRAPSLTLAGTVYPSGHEPANCNGATAATVVITDANGKTTNLTTNAAGNFYLRAALATPYTAKVVYQGKERAMIASQTDGDCNACHSDTGAQAAPGRITLPY